MVDIDVGELETIKQQLKDLQDQSNIQASQISSMNAFIEDGRKLALRSFTDLIFEDIFLAARKGHLVVKSK